MQITLTVCEVIAKKVYVNQNIRIRSTLDTFINIHDMAETSIFRPQICLFLLPYLEYLDLAYDR